MAHAAELNSNNKVIRVLAFDNSLEPNVIEFATNLLGGNWVQTSYNSNFRFNYAGINYTYDSEADAFIAPSPNCHPELILNTTNYQWECSNAEHIK
jgi:hypothetical protein